MILIDLERILPSRRLSSSFFNKIRNTSTSITLSQIKIDYLSYVLELNYEVGSVLKSADKEIFEFKSNNFGYSSFNTASGEDVLSRIISDIVDAENNSMVLIEEIEIGLHPKIQRRLMDVVHHESVKNKKQFIITTHSPTILSTVDKKSRIFIESSKNGYKSIPEISINAAFSKMDSVAYPLINLFLEDSIAKRITSKAISKIANDMNLIGFNDLINIIISGSSNDTYMNFVVHKRTYDKKRNDSGYACILDGDQRLLISKGQLQYPEQDGLFFLYSNDSPELFLVKEYLKIHSHANLEYHLKSNPHCLFSKMVEFSICINEDEAFETCWNCFIQTAQGTTFLNELCKFLIDSCKKFSPEL